MSIVYYLCLAFLVACVAYMLSSMQGLLTLGAQEGMAHQPYSAFVVGKGHFLLLALFEAPAFLTGVCAGYISSLVSFENGAFSIAILLLLLGLCLSSLATIYYAAGPSRAFMKSFAAHPEHASRALNTVLIFVSLMQTPFIFALVSTFLAVIQLHDMQSAPSLEIYLIAGAPFMVSIVASGVLKSLSRAISSIARVADYAPYVFQQAVGRCFISLALVEAPVLFAFLISILTMTMKIRVFSFLYVVGFLFAIVAWCVSHHSALVVEAEIHGWYARYILRDALTRTSLLAQVFLDARVLYMFIVTILILFRCVI